MIDATSRNDWAAAWRIARRELRDGFRHRLGGFRILIACLALGVAAIAAVGATRQAVEESVARDASRLLGGDVEARLLYRDLSPEQQAFFDDLGRTTRIAEMRGMALVDDRRQLVSLKAVDAAYPLYGGLTLDPALDREATFGLRDGAYGAAVEQAFLDASGLGVGDRFRLNRSDFEIR
ncbi:MAG: ABC transporter permease, partial [Alphaproteobacteria bacterium]